MDAISAQIAEHERAIVELKRKQEKHIQDDPVNPIANKLHDLLCHYNHAHQCPWEYETKEGNPDWSGAAHRRYADRARKLVATLDSKYNIDEIIEIVDAL